MGSGADLRTCLILGFLLSSHDMVTLVMHIKDERIRNAALLRYTCGHDGRYFGLFHLIVMDHHIAINSKLVFFGCLSGPPGFTCWISFAPVFSLIYC